VLAYEPDRAGDLFSIAPRLMMNLADVPATELVQWAAGSNTACCWPASRRRWMRSRPGRKSRLAAGEKLQGVRDARAELRSALDRAQRFLNLAALVSVILAGVGVAIAARRFAARHWDSVAILRCVGATQGAGDAAVPAGTTVAGAAGRRGGVWHGRLSRSVRVERRAWPTGEQHRTARAVWLPILPALATGFITLLGFGLPPLLRLREVPPLRVLRRDLGPVNPRLLALYGPAIAATVALLVWQAGEWRLALYVCAGVAGTVVALSLAAWGLVKSLNLLRGQVGVAWRFGLANIARRGPVARCRWWRLGLGLMALLILTLVRTDLLSQLAGQPAAPMRPIIF
jgi:putative ABC transport system permease protein